MLGWAVYLCTGATGVGSVQPIRAAQWDKMGREEKGAKPGGCSSVFAITKEADEHLKQLGNLFIVIVAESDLLPGPYTLVGNEMRDVWKIVDDSFGTCMTTLKTPVEVRCPSPAGQLWRISCSWVMNTTGSPSESFQPFQHMCPDSQFPSFALRSRIKTRAAIDGRISGFRVIVKDNIHLKGTRVSQGNKAFHDTFAPQPESAPCIQ